MLLRSKSQVSRLLDVNIPESAAPHLACYLYGVARRQENFFPNYQGIDCEQVYVVVSDDLCAFVHKCEAKAYESKDENVIKNWVLAHQSVLDQAKQDAGNILPMSFDTLIKAAPQDSTENTVRKWLHSNHDELITLLEKIEGKNEFGIQISYEAEKFVKKVEECSEMVRLLQQEISGKPRGMAYFYREKLERALQSELKNLLQKTAQDFLSKIQKYCDELVEEKLGKGVENRPLLLNLSCLVRVDKVNELGEELDRIQGVDGVTVRFTGPWPPYSFVGLKARREKMDETRS